MLSFLPHVRDRLQQLTETLHQLKDRVREAVASEMGRVVSEAVRDVLTAALRTPALDAPPRPATRPHWADDEDDERWADDPYAVAARPPASPRNWAAAASTAVLATRWLWLRRLALLPCLAVGAIAGLVVLIGHPVLAAALDAVATAAGLVAATRPPLT